MKHLCRLLLLTVLSLHAGAMHAEEAPTQAGNTRPIPFKTEPTPVEEQGAKTALILILLLGTTGTGLYLLRRRMPRLAGLAGLDIGQGRLRVIERVRLNPRSTLYLISFDQREILLAQCGDHVQQLDPALASTLPAVSPEEARE